VTLAVVGAPPAGTRLGATDLLVVQDTGGRRYAVTGGRRLLVRTPAALVAIGADGAAVTGVSQAWINALPAGPDLTLLTVAGLGSPGHRVGTVSTRVGQVLVAASVGGADRYYAVQRDGLAPVTQVEAALLLGNPAERAAYAGTPQAVRVSPADVTGAPASTARLAGGYPDLVPRATMAGTGQPLCLAVDGSGSVAVYLATDMPLPDGAHPVPVTPAPGQPGPTADEVFVPPGAGALVREQPAPGVGTGTTYLITDQGVRYPLGGPDAVKALGYDAVPPAPLAATVLALFPLGPTLDVADAGKIALAGH
ncbi:MAG TPA: type VII secretion protein EccB, partial [Rugosimonospora sp.]|nr:type VII secretion protein EccB [Rugosimonospora sp.]